MPNCKEPLFKTPDSFVSNSIRSFMLDVGGAAHLKGFNYLCRAVEIVYMHPEMIHRVVNGIYTRIAEENATTSVCVERDIRTELKTISESGQLWVLDEHFRHFSLSAKSLSSRRFIALFTEKLRRKLADRSFGANPER